MPVEDQGRAHQRGIAAVGALPGVVRHHHHGRGRGGVVGVGEHAAGCRPCPERGEVAAGDVVGAQRPGGVGHALASRAEAGHAGLHGGDRLEFRRRRLDLLVEGIREHAPAVLRAARHAAVGAVADAVEAGRVDHRQRLQHHRVDEAEDGRGAADAQRQREHGGHGEDTGRRQLAGGMDEVAQGGHARIGRKPGANRCARPAIRPT